MVAFDTTFLTLMFIPEAKHSIPDARDRVNFLIADLNGRGEQIIVPTPALSEVFVRCGIHQQGQKRRSNRDLGKGEIRSANRSYRESLWSLKNLFRGR